jgi:general secretion pathway protein G
VASWGGWSVDEAHTGGFGFRGCRASAKLARTHGVRSEAGIVIMFVRIPAARGTSRNERAAPGAARGFTLIEVLLVIAVIAVLAVIVIPRVMPSLRESKESALRAELHQIRMAIELFHAHTGAYPATLADLVTTAAPAVGIDDLGHPRAIAASDYRGPYVDPYEGVPHDPITRTANWTYSTSPPTVGDVRSSATGQTIDGKPYSDF